VTWYNKVLSVLVVVVWTAVVSPNPVWAWDPCPPGSCREGLEPYMRDCPDCQGLDGPTCDCEHVEGWCYTCDDNDDGCNDSFGYFFEGAYHCGNCDCDADGYDDLYDPTGVCGCACDDSCDVYCDCDGDGIFTDGPLGPGDTCGSICGACTPGGLGPAAECPSCCKNVDPLTGAVLVCAAPGGSYTCYGCDTDGDGICDGVVAPGGGPPVCENCDCVNAATGEVTAGGLDADGDGWCDSISEGGGGGGAGTQEGCCNLEDKWSALTAAFTSAFGSLTFPGSVVPDTEGAFYVDVPVPHIGGGTDSLRLWVTPDTSTAIGAGVDAVRSLVRGLIACFFGFFWAGKVWTVLRQY